MDDVKPAARADEAHPPGSPGQHHTATENPSFVPLRLVLQPGGLSVELTRPDMVVGRHTDADIRVQLPDVSRRHCRFVFGEGRWQVFDLNSLNGLFVNGHKVHQATLRPRDVLQIGSCLFEVQFPLVAHEPASNSAHILGTIADALPRPGEEQRLAS